MHVVNWLEYPGPAAAKQVVSNDRQSFFKKATQLPTGCTPGLHALTQQFCDTSMAFEKRSACCIAQQHVARHLLGHLLKSLLTGQDLRL